MVGGEPEFDACGGYGEVRGLDPKGDGFLAVRSGPGGGYRLVDRLHNGDPVYFCGEKGQWIAVVYGKDMSQCGVGSPIPERQAYRGPCRSGWAHRKWLVLLAG